MLDFLNPGIIPFLVFGLRVINNAIGTVRVIAMNDDRRALGFGLASLESLLFAYTAGIVLTDLDNIPNLAAYVFGFAVGGYVGMFIERRFLNVYHIVDVTAREAVAREIAVHLRYHGHGVTEVSGEGAMGHVMQLRIVAHHTDVREVLQRVREIKQDAFITVEESRMIRGGWIRSQNERHR
jgi:uncharacterized protein YebE (UPF0316 family)